MGFVARLTETPCKLSELVPRLLGPGPDGPVPAC